MGRAIDLLITYRVIKLLVTPWEKHDAFKYGIIDKKGKILRKSKTLKDRKEKNAYTILHRFIFNLKRILQKVGLGSRIGTFGVALAMLIKEGKFNDESKYLLEDKLLEYLKKKKLFNYDDIQIKEQFFNDSNYLKPGYYSLKYNVVDENTEVISKKGDVIIVEELTKPLETFFGMDIFEVKVKGGDRILISQEAVNERL
jgi:hypothetical protein|tara:strand:- start:6 stop:602 length:597 start_codon:yes stop_codon:yes gene_type:complete